MLLRLLLAALYFSATSAQLPTGCSWAATEGGPWTLSGCTILTFESVGEGLSTLHVSREPGLWLPAIWRPPGWPARPLLLADVTLRLPTCAGMIELAVQECKFHLSATWPSPGFQVGDSYMYYVRLVGRNSTVERVGLVCPHADWSALVTARTTSGTWETGVTGPCGTATVSSGQQLIDALQQLQPSHAAVLLTLANDISLPANPTPQRTPTSTDDANPLVTIYRHVTLAGIGGGSASLVSASSSGGTNSSSGGGTPAPAASRTELNLRLRRNAFDLVAAGQQQQPGRKPLLALADVYLVNGPPGPPSSWPIGLIGNAQWYMGLNRSGTAGLQARALRCLQTYDAGKIGYLSYMRTQAAANGNITEAWLPQVIPPVDQVATEEGSIILRASISDFMVAYASGFTRAALITPSAPLDFDLWSLPPLLVPAPVLSPTSFAVARGAAQLLALIQEPWNRGQRVIMVVENVTLQAGEWPAAGAALTYNLTLTGPTTEPPIWLDTAGLPLVRLAAAPAQSSNTTAAGAAGNVTLQLLRLRLVGLAPPLLVVSPQDLAQADAEGLMRGGGGTPAVRAWRDRCVAQHAADTAALLVPGLRTVRHQIINCTLELPAGHVDLLTALNVPDACTSGTADAVACGLVTSSSSNGSSTTSGTPNAGAMSALLARSLVVSGQASFLGANLSDTTAAPPISFVTATLSGVLLTGSRAVIRMPTTAAPASTSDSAITSAAGGTAVSSTPCHVVALAAAIIAPPPSPPPIGGDSSSGGGAAPVGAVVGSVVGGIAALALCAAAAAVFMLRRRRSRQAATARLPTKEAERTASSGLKTVGQQQESNLLAPAGTIGTVVATALKGNSRGQEASTTSTHAPVAAAAVAVAVVAHAGASSDGLSAGTDCWTLSLGEDKGNAPAAVAPRTMADELLMKGRPPTAATAQPAGSSSAAPPAAGGHLLCTRVAEEIGALIMRTKATVAATDLQAGKSSRGRGGLKVLGRGGYGVVYLGAWRGLPAAIKIMTIQSDDSDQRREQLAREVALTTTLTSPYIVPTYCYSLHAAKDGEGPHHHTRLVLVSSGGRMGGGGASEELEQVVGEEEGGSTAIRLRLAMQYCEGGTLRDALRTGKFRSGATSVPASFHEMPMTCATIVAPAPAAGVTDVLSASSSSSARAPEAAEAEAAAASLVEGMASVARDATAAAARVDPVSCSGEQQGLSDRDSSTAGAAAIAAVGEQRKPPLAVQGQCAAACLSRSNSKDDGGGLGGEIVERRGATTTTNSDATAAAAATTAAAVPSATQQQQPQNVPETKRLEWLDVVPSANLPLSLIAALDVLRGLAYLHSHGIVHGDLTDNNILLKSVLPRLPHQQSTSQPRETASRLDTQQQQAQQEQSTAAPAVALELGAGATMLPAPAAAGALPLGQDGRGGAASSSRGAVGAGPAPLDSSLSHCIRLQQKKSQSQVQPGAYDEATASGEAGGSNATAPTASQWTTHSAGSTGSVDCGSIAAAGQQLHSGGGGSSYAASDTSRWSSVPQGKQQKLAFLLLRTTFKIADFGLSIQLHGPSQTHLSNMGQGTPFFAAPEVVAYGRLSPDADIYGFGIIFYLLLHGVYLGDIRHLLPFLAFTSIAPLLLSRTSPSLPPAAHRILSGCLAMQPEERPSALELIAGVEALLQEVVGPELARLLLGAERREHVADT